MLRPKRKTAVIASASLFAALYAVLGVIPVSRLLLGSGFLTASNIITALAGMLFGPLVGGGAVLMGDLIDVYAGLSTGATAVSVIAADLAVVTTAGLAFSRKRKACLILPLTALVVYTLDPISVLFVGPVPFAWMHLSSFVALAIALALEGRSKIDRLGPAFVVAVAFGSLMCGQLVGTVVGQNLLVRVYGVFTADHWRSIMTGVFFAYPVERVFFAAAGSIVAIPVLRAIAGNRGKEPRGS